MMCCADWLLQSLGSQNRILQHLRPSSPNQVRASHFQSIQRLYPSIHLVILLVILVKSSKSAVPQEVIQLQLAIEGMMCEEGLNCPMCEPFRTGIRDCLPNCLHQNWKD